MDSNKRAKWRGKNYERRIAKLIRGSVVGRSKAIKTGARYTQIDCQHPPDVVNEWLSVECKYLKTLPAWLDKVMAQAVRNCPEGLVPVAWVGGREARSHYVIMTEEDFLDLHERR